MEMSEEEFALQSANEALIHTRNQVHAFDPASLEKVAGEGLETARSVESRGRAALDEIANRRRLAAIPLGMIAVVALALYRKIRSLDREPPPGA
jgi:hypothetical protein